MDTNSTINKNWTLCIFSSFIGCIFLLACLNHGKNNLKLSTLPSVGISITSSNPTSSIKLLEPTKLIKTENPEIEEVKCNISDGKWVYDPERSPVYRAGQCPFLSDQVSCQRNGRPDFEYEKWSWEGCEIPRFNGTNMLEKLRGRRVIIVGDSLNRNQWESLACLLYSAIPSSRAHVDARSALYKVFKAKDYNCSVEFHWSSFLVEYDDKRNGGRILRLDKISPSAPKWRGADVMVFNTGHWWVHRGKFRAWEFFEYDGKLVEGMELESAFTMAIGTWAHWIDHNVDTTKTTVFFRSISPEHKGKQWCYNRTEPIMDESFVYAFPQQVKEIVDRIIGGMKTPVTYLNITKLSEYRRDAHPAIYARNQEKQLITKQQPHPESRSDCSHWCLPGVPDTWNRLLYASLLLDSSKDNSTPSHLVA